MCEESACLVPPLDQAQNGLPETSLSSRSAGGRAGSFGGEALVGFHEDAISQAAVGRAQFLLTLVLGLGLIAECSELSILNFILPAAELQLCMDERRKGWIVPVTLLALSAGSLAWGLLGDRVGRRRALMSALSIATIFSSVAAVMPTYGTFLTARFCSGLGISGAIPLAFTYLSETCPRATRTRYTGLLHSFWPLGAILSATVAVLVLPNTGAELAQDSREHWSSWHKFLILNTLPTLAAVVGLIWTSESPRYLLEAAREVEALQVYQRLHRLNRSRTQYGLTELELPGRSSFKERTVSPTRNAITHGFLSLREAFERIASPSLFRTTILLLTLHLIMGMVYTGVGTFASLKLRDIQQTQYDAMRRHVVGGNISGTFNASVENVEYRDVCFHNVTFTHLEFNHVKFVNCLVEEAEFSNVKSSITYFYNSTIRNSRFVDTDLTEQHFIKCTLQNNTFLSLISECIVDFDFNIYMDELYEETVAWAAPMVPSLFLIGFILESVYRPPILIGCFALITIAAVGLFFCVDFIKLLIVESVIKTLIMVASNVITMVVIEGYPCHLRCTAHGMMRSVFHLASLASMPIYSTLTHILLFTSMITVSLGFFATILSSRIQDNSKVLL